MAKKKLDVLKIYVPDTSAIIEGTITKMINDGKIKSGRIVVHRAVLSELESQANHGREVGFLGLDELKKLSQMKNKDVVVEYVGARPKEFEIKYAKSGEIDAMIRDEALKLVGDVLFITLDRVDADAAAASGLNVMFIEQPKEVKPLNFEKFFKKDVSSVHIKADTNVVVKKGSPGHWEVEKTEHIMKKEEVETLEKEIIDYARMRVGKSFLEIDRKGSAICQIEDYRILITRPPFSEGWEITIVKPIVKLSLKDYKLDKKLLELLETKASGVLISGAPGNGKSTFAEALIEFYFAMGKIIKTVESPRDLRVPPGVTQYSKTLSSPDEIRDVLLLSRPDYTIFDEMRNHPDFLLYSDLRLAGVGMIGVVHATTPIDSIQRFVNKVELGMIPSIVDTVIFIQDGNVAKVYNLSMTVKVPSGMIDSDLGRPVVEIRDAFTRAPEYEIYTYGEATVVMPVKKRVDNSEEMIRKLIGVECELKMQGGKATVYIRKHDMKRVIGKKGKNIMRIEREAGMAIEVVGH